MIAPELEAVIDGDHAESEYSRWLAFGSPADPAWCAAVAKRDDVMRRWRAGELTETIDWLAVEREAAARRQALVSALADLLLADLLHNPPKGR